MNISVDSVKDRPRDYSVVFYIGTQAFKLSVWYDEGGHSYVTGTSSPRGYYMSCVPVLVENGWIRSRAFNGAKKFIQSAQRFSKKTFNIIKDKYIYNIETSINPEVEGFISWVQSRYTQT